MVEETRESSEGAGGPPGQPGAVKARRKGRKWKVLLATAVVILGVISLPFLFTGAIVRYLVAQSAYKNLPLEFRSASLSPSGALTVRGVIIGDQGESKGKRLAAADLVRVTFAWGEIRAGRVKTIEVENIDATLRPGADTGLTLLRLFSPPAEENQTPASPAAAPTTVPAPIANSPVAPAAQPAPPTTTSAQPASVSTPAATSPASTPAGDSFWFDELVIAGKVRIEGYAWQDSANVHAGETLPARLVVTSTGSAAAPVRDFALSIGEPGGAAGRSLVSHFRLNTLGTDDVLVVDSLALSNLFGKSTVTADGRYNVSRDILEKASAHLRGLEGADLQPVLTAGMTAAGRIEGELEYSASAAGGILSATIQPAAPLTMKVPEGTLTLTGSPVMSLHATYDAAGRAIQIETAAIHGIDSLHADAGFVKHLQSAPLIAPGSAAESALKSLQEGAFVALGDAVIAGRLNLAGAAPLFTGSVTIRGVSAGKSPDSLIVRNIAFAGAVEVPISDSLDFKALRITHGTLSADQFSAGDNVIRQFSAALSAEQGKVTMTQSAFSFADGTATADAAATLPAQLDSLHIQFTHLDQQILTAGLYPTVFTAEGHVTAKLTLERKPGESLTGSIDLASEESGRLKLSREASTDSFGPAAKAIAAQPGSMLPPNFDEIVIGQLADYPYERGHLVVQDAADGMLLLFDYRRPPLKEGEPGYSITVPVGGQMLKASPAFQLGSSMSVKNYSVMSLLNKFLGLRDSLLTTATAPATRPTTAPVTSPEKQ